MSFMIKELQNENDRLQKDIQLAETELKEATSAMNTMADDYAKLKVSLYANCQALFLNINLCNKNYAPKIL